MADEARWPKMMRCIVSHPQESIKGYSQIDCLCDELLTEILVRLPNHKSVIRCTCVCKRWAAVASHPSFIPEFIGLKLVGFYNGHINLNKEHTFAFVMQYKPNRLCRMGQGFDSFFSPTMFNVQESSVSCIGDDIASVSALGFASCKDLLLYWKRNNVEYDYYISNIQTMQHIVLPSPPYYYKKPILAGFICDTFLSCEREIVVNTAYHYSVVAVYCTIRPSTKLTAHILSSHCGTQWCEKVLSLQKGCIVNPSSPSSGFCFCFDGKLHFTCLEGFFGFDHDSINKFDDEIQCHLVEWPVGMLQGYHRVCVSQEKLYVPDYCVDTDRLSVWVLEDYKEGNWVLKYRIETREWVSRDKWMAKKFKRFKWHRVLGLHPSCSDVIYVVIPGCIFLCNLATKMVEWACDIPIAGKYKNYINDFYALPIVYQSLPTPLLRLANSLEDGSDATPPS